MLIEKWGWHMLIEENSTEQKRSLQCTKYKQFFQLSILENHWFQIEQFWQFIGHPYNWVLHRFVPLYLFWKSVVIPFFPMIRCQPTWDINPIIFRSNDVLFFYQNTFQLVQMLLLLKWKKSRGNERNCEKGIF